MTDLHVLQMLVASVALGLAAMAALAILRPDDKRSSRFFLSLVVGAGVAYGSFFALTVVTA